MKLSIKNMSKAVVVLGAVLLLAGCATVRTSLSASKDVNPDINGQASPIVVKVYQLRDDTAFNSASFFTVFDSPETALQSQLLTVQEVVLAPGTEQRLWLPLQKETQYVGVVAGYRDISTATWRAELPVSPHHLTGVGLDVTVAKNGITVQQARL